MTETFDHLFGGWKSAPARRHVNPDGSAGGIVAVSAQIADGVTIAGNCLVWPQASIGDRASVGDGASIGEEASIGVGASIGREALIGNGASIGREALIGYRAWIGNGALIGDRAAIGDGASIGHRTSIGNGALIGDRASIGAETSIGDGTSIGYLVSIGNGAVIDSDDWWISVGQVGAYKRVVTAVHSQAHGLRWWVGCQHGITTARFIKRLRKDHTPNGEPDSVADEYCHLIGFVTTHPQYLARIAKGMRP